MIMSVSG